MLLFSLATLVPAAFLMGGALLGGGWILAAVLMITVLCYLIDRLFQGPASQLRPGQEFPAGDTLSVVLALLHLPMLGLAIWAVSGQNDLPIPERAGLFIGFGLFFGQVSHPNAHELIHRAPRALRGLGVMTYATLLFGHHVSAHRLVHHVHVGTELDPNSAPLGRGFWRFAPRAWLSSFQAGLRAEQKRRARNPHIRRPFHPYFIYIIVALMTISSSYFLAGTKGILGLFALAGYAQIQILLADYVQHYGLRRSTDAQERPGPVGPAHSWNSPHLWSSAMMLNAPRHSDHHLHPTRPYPALQLEKTMPVLPHSLPVMALIATIPPLWRKIMDPRVKALKP